MTRNKRRIKRREKRRRQRMRAWCARVAPALTETIVAEINRPSRLLGLIVLEEINDD